MAGATVAALTVEEVVQPVLRIVHGLVGVADGAGPVAQVILRRVRAPRLPLALLDARAALGRGSVGGAGGREALLRRRPRRRRGRRGRRRGEGGRQRQQEHHHLTSPLQHPLSPSMRCCAQLGEVGMEVEGGTGGRGLWRTRAHAGLGLWRPCVMALAQHQRAGGRRSVAAAAGKRVSCCHMASSLLIAPAGPLACMGVGGDRCLLLQDIGVTSIADRPSSRRRPQGARVTLPPLP
jgi:hypothetical protein